MKLEKQNFNLPGTAEKLFFTSDDLVFFDLQLALNHSKGLADDTVTTKTRDEVERETLRITDDWQADEDFDLLYDEFGG
jgi:hypothetical protein